MSLIHIHAITEEEFLSKAPTNAWWIECSTTNHVVILNGEFLFLVKFKYFIFNFSLRGTKYVWTFNLITIVLQPYSKYIHSMQFQSRVNRISYSIKLLPEFTAGNCGHILITIEYHYKLNACYHKSAYQIGTVSKIICFSRSCSVNFLQMWLILKHKHSCIRTVEIM